MSIDIKFIRIAVILSALFFASGKFCYANTAYMYWWQDDKDHEPNFGDDLSRVLVERITGYKMRCMNLDSNKKLLLAAGSILHFARNNDIIWGSGFREDPMLEKGFDNIDIRAVRGPRTRAYLLKKGINCPEVYGDPAVLTAYLFPEFKKQTPKYDYIIIPNKGEIDCFTPYKNVVLPTEPWNEIIKKILQSKLVISGSLHGIIVAESFGVPARLLKMTWIEALLKYQDYYESTGRADFTYATSVQEALRMGGERPGYIDIEPLLAAFPWDYFQQEP